MSHDCPGCDCRDAEIDALKAELVQCRELSELRLQSEQKLIAERDRLRAALEEISAVYGELNVTPSRIVAIARRALDPSKR